VSFLNPLYNAVAWLMVHIHSALLAPIFGTNSGASWALSIVLLTVGMRLVLFPVFVKQIRNQRAMQKVQPKMKELQAKYKNDKEKLNQEMMALWKEAGANPFSGCLPLVLQIPIFISLFHTLRQLKPQKSCPNPHTITAACYHSFPGFSSDLVGSAAQAKIFGVPISASFTSSATFLHDLGGSQNSTRILCLVLTILMGASTFITQRQLMSRNGPAEGSMAQQQKILLYVFPIMFLFYGFKFPIGVLLYWLTTNVWSMAQQSVVIKRMDTEVPVAAGAATAPAGPLPGAKPPPGAKSAPPGGPPKPAIAGGPAGGTASGSNGATAPKTPSPGKSTPRSSGTRRPASRTRNRNRRGRR
jgi:YidC/Oxa1 family membrane protein insertase